MNIIQNSKRNRIRRNTEYGRKKYVNQTIKSIFKSPGSRVSIIGPGGSGKNQLSFKAIHQFEREGIFDLVLPIYFDLNPMSLSKFLSNMAEGIGIPVK